MYVLALLYLLNKYTISYNFSEEERSQGMVRVTAQQSAIASRELQRVDAQRGKIFFNRIICSFPLHIL